MRKLFEPEPPTVAPKSKVTPLVEPRCTLLAAPKALMVDAPEFKRLKVVELVMSDVVMVGLSLKTAKPVPVSSVKILASSADVAAPAAVVRFFVPSVTTKDEADKPVRLIPVPVIAPVPLTLKPVELMALS